MWFAIWGGLGLRPLDRVLTGSENRSNVDGLLGFAKAAGRNGMTDRAREAVEQGLKAFPKDPRFSALAAEIGAGEPKPQH